MAWSDVTAGECCSSRCNYFFNQEYNSNCRHDKVADFSRWDALVGYGNRNKSSYFRCNNWMWNIS